MSMSILSYSKLIKNGIALYINVPIIRHIHIMKCYDSEVPFMLKSREVFTILLLVIVLIERCICHFASKINLK